MVKTGLIELSATGQSMGVRVSPLPPFNNKGVSKNEYKYRRLNTRSNQAD